MQNAPKQSTGKDQVHDQDVNDELDDGTQLLGGLYKIESFLNAGGFGITYLAKDSLERTVVIKECYPSSMCRRVGTKVKVRSKSHEADLQAVIKCFTQEARSLSKLEHPNIVKVHLVFEDNDTAYMAIDYIDGPDLLDMIEQNDPFLTPQTITSMLRQVLDAIGYVHQLGVLHRDIAPDNILIDETGKPTLIDFGAAREQASKKTRVLTALSCVKDGYSPQEFYVQGSTQSNASDLYALGATFYHAITRDTPPPSQSRLVAVAEGGEDPYQPLVGRFPEYSEDFLRAIDKAMEVVPKNRMQSAAEWVAMMNGSDPENVIRLTPPAEEPGWSTAAAIAAVVAEDAKADVKEDAAQPAPAKAAGSGSSRVAFLAGGSVAALAAGAAGIYLAMSPSDPASVPAPTEQAETSIPVTSPEPSATAEAPDASAPAEPTVDVAATPSPAVESEVPASDSGETAATAEQSTADVAEPELPVTRPDLVEPDALVSDTPSEAIAAEPTEERLATTGEDETAIAPSADVQFEIIESTTSVDTAEEATGGVSAIPPGMEAEIASPIEAQTFAGNALDGSALGIAPITDILREVDTAPSPITPRAIDSASLPMQMSEREVLPFASEVFVEDAPAEPETVAEAEVTNIITFGAPAEPADTSDEAQDVVAALTPDSTSDRPAFQIAPDTSAETESAPDAPTENTETAFEIITFGTPAPQATPTIAGDFVSARWDIEMPFVVESANTEYGTFPQVTELTGDPVSLIENEWLTPGVVILSIDGQLVQGVNGLEDAFSSSATSDSDGRLAASILVQIPGQEAFVDRALRLPSARIVTLENGLSFRTDLEGGSWVTRVTATGGVSDLEVGDRIVSEGASGIRFSGPTDLETALTSVAGSGFADAEFTVRRDGRQLFVTAPLVE
ncbi:protein kinase domain-containing protein [Aestuariibius sp. 2305UL40-4]|uniref:protein kinase domain-containing protein n=1 Tax=Aestuariibius violaceus TaxID=3234132 RepID=UPI00345E467A